MRIKTLLTLVIGGTLLIASLWKIQHSFDWPQIFHILCQGNALQFLTGSAITTICYWLLRTWRWKILLGAAGCPRIPFVDLYLCTASGLALALITPFQSGEAVKVELIRKVGQMDRFDGYSSFLLERILDLMVVLLLAFVATLSNPVWRVDPAILLIIGSALIIVAGFAWYLVRMLKPESGDPWNQSFHRLRSYTKQPGSLASAIVLTVCSWLVVAWAWQWCLKCVTVDLGIVESIELMAIMTLVNVLSLIPGAVGISEAGIAMSLQNLGYDAVNSQAGALILRLYSLVMLVLGSTHLFAWRLVRRRLWL